MVILNDSNFEQEVIKSELPVLVDFYADWCRSEEHTSELQSR